MRVAGLLDNVENKINIVKMQFQQDVVLEFNAKVQGV
jgi:hypothetical protein